MSSTINEGMYYEIYELFCNHIYGAGAVLTSYQDMTITLLSTIAVLFCVSLPFFVVWRALRIFIS